MKLVRLIYWSEMNRDVEVDIERLLDKAIERNSEANVTGFLAFDRHRFVQVLEGGATAVTAVFGRICQDARHRHVTLVEVSPITERTFGDWAMGYCARLARYDDVIKRFSAEPHLRPEAMTAEGMHAMLVALRDLAVEHAGSHIERAA